MHKITFRPDDGEPVDFFILAQTTHNGKTYILVTDSEQGDGDALVLRNDTPKRETEDEDALFCLVEDDQELSACAKIFGKLLGEEDIEILE